MLTKMTPAQRGAVKRAWHRMSKQERPTYREFRASVQATFGCDDAVVVPWCGMWIVIERDGYTHS